MRTPARPQNWLKFAGIGARSYCECRTLSGDYLLFFQPKAEWVDLCARHPDLFDQTVAYEEKVQYEAPARRGRRYTWSGTETLVELLSRRDEIKHTESMERESLSRRNIRLIVLDDEDHSLGVPTGER